MVRRQALLTGVFTALGLLQFFGYLLATVHARGTLGVPLEGNGGMTGAVALGLGMLAGTIVLTGAYVFLNNRYVEPLLGRLRRDRDG